MDGPSSSLDTDVKRWFLWAIGGNRLGGVSDEGAQDAGGGGAVCVYRGGAGIYLGWDLGVLLVSGNGNAAGRGGGKAYRDASGAGRWVYPVCQRQEFWHIPGRLGERGAPLYGGQCSDAQRTGRGAVRYLNGNLCGSLFPGDTQLCYRAGAAGGLSGSAAGREEKDAGRVHLRHLERGRLSALYGCGYPV